MKSNAPWSVKGIARDARETAKEAARREGMTVGEWLNRVIYTAGDPESATGEIEGLKASDLVTAIEHLNARVQDAEAKGAAALDSLSRNFAGLVERTQRLERTRPGEIGPDFAERLAKLEAKAGDRQRIEALRALERAVGQVALQYAAAQKETVARLEATDRRVEALAARLEAGGADGAVEAINHLKDTIDGMAARVARAERIASEAASLKDAAAASTDPDFVERTGARLRALGDEVKRGGDQIRTLEASIKKLSAQIDAAERRSSEGVQKVADSIADLRANFSPVAGEDGARGDFQSAVNAVAERAEGRIAELQKMLDAMAARIDSPAPAGAPEAPLAGEESSRAAAIAPPPFDEDFDAFDLDAEDGAEDEDAPSGGFSFDLDAEEAPLEDAGAEDIEASEQGTNEPEAQDPLDALLAEFDPVEETPTPTGASESEDSEDKEEAAEPAPAPDYLKQARTAAREAAERAESDKRSRRRLTPRQRALLAAKIRRKRLAQEGLGPVAETARSSPVDSPAAPEPAEETESRADSGLAGKAAGMLSGLRARLPGSGDKADDDESGRESADGAGPLARARAYVRARPVTFALASATALAAVALVFVISDQASDATRPSTFAAGPDQAAAPETARPQLQSSQSAPDQAVDPRQLYLDSVASLKDAGSDAQTREAIAGIEQAAALGHPPAQLQLGELYKLGQGVEEDPERARLWYERAAEGGNVLAMHRIGVMLARGQGGPRNEAAAISWFEQASAFGLVDSQYNLGALYHPGADAPSAAQDAAQAYYWYALAARNGDGQAGELAEAVAAGLAPGRRAAIDAEVAAWTANDPDERANEVEPAS